MKFRKKPVVIEAMQYTDDKSAVVIYDWSGGVFHYANGQQQVSTEEGVMAASPGDWIIRGSHGEFYPCKPDIFDAVYEPVKESTDG